MLRSTRFSLLRSSRFVLAIVACLILLLASTGMSFAAGEPFTLTGHDLQVDVDSRWVGCSRGGYCPVRVRVINRGPTRTLTFRISRFAGQPLPTVKQTLEVPQNATLALTLSVPMVSESTNGELRVEHNGAPLDRMNHSLTFPDNAQWERCRPALIVVAPAVVDTQPFEDGVATAMHLGGGGVGGRGYGHRSVTSLVLPPSSLPSSWIDYSGVDLVAIPEEAFARLPGVNRAALVQWACCGGTLLIVASETGMKQPATIQKLLSAEATTDESWSWRVATEQQRQTAQIVSVDASGGVSTMSPPPANVPGEWSRQSPPFQVADLGFGKVALFAQFPFPGSAQDWFWLLNSTGGESQWSWIRRHGISARGDNPDFLQFLIPGLRGVPVVMFLVLITLFSIVIGPINYWVLARRKRLHLLIVTIPAIALVTSLMLFSYAVVAHGFGIKARVRSLTLIDQPSQSAVTLARLSLYAGQTPSAGMRFSRDTAVYPIWPEGEHFESGQVDWSDSQVLTSGWLRSRTRTQFLTVRHRTERGRMELKPSGADRLSAANGFEWGFEHLIVQDEQGRLFVSKDLAAGATAELNLVKSTDELRSAAEALLRYPLELPEGITGINRNDLLWGGHPYRSRRMYYGFGGAVENPMAIHSQLEQTWHELIAVAQRSENNSAPRRRYFGLTSQSPHVELGVSKAKEISSSHVVMGRW